MTSLESLSDLVQTYRFLTLRIPWRTSYGGVCRGILVESSLRKVRRFFEVGFGRSQRQPGSSKRPLEWAPHGSTWLRESSQTGGPGFGRFQEPKPAYRSVSPHEILDSTWSYKMHYILKEIFSKKGKAQLLKKKTMMFILVFELLSVPPRSSVSVYVIISSMNSIRCCCVPTSKPGRIRAPTEHHTGAPHPESSTSVRRFTVGPADPGRRLRGRRRSKACGPSTPSSRTERSTRWRPVVQ